MKPRPVDMDYLFTLRAELGPREDAGPGPIGSRSYNAVVRGTFEGPRLRGVVLPGSGDWMLVRLDGTMLMDARAVLKTDDGAVIHMSYGGRIVIAPQLMDEVRDPARREAIDPDRYYLRTVPTFETGAGRYGWLNDLVAVGRGFLLAGGIGYDVFAVA